MDFRPCYLFQSLTDKRVKQIISVTKAFPVETGQCIFNEGEEATALHIVKEGAVELVTKIEDSFEMPIAILRNPGDCFGTTALIPPYLYSLSARCVSEGILLILERSEFQRIIEEDYEVGCTIMTNLAQHYLERLKETRQESKIYFKTVFRSLHA